MKHRIFPILPPTHVAVILGLLCLFTTTARTQVKMPDRKNGSNAQSRDSICKRIEASALLKVLRKQEGKAFLEVYALKHSSSMVKQDFDLAVFVKNEKGRYLDSMWKGNRQQFQNEVANYFRFLKQNHVSASEVVSGYLIALNNDYLKTPNALRICVSVPTGNLQYYYSGNNQTFPSDSCCKCPPKCTSLMKAAQTEGVMKKVYNQKMMAKVEEQ